MALMEIIPNTVFVSFSGWLACWSDWHHRRRRWIADTPALLGCTLSGILSLGRENFPYATLSSSRFRLALSRDLPRAERRKSEGDNQIIKGINILTFFM